MPRFPTYQRRQGLGDARTASYADDGAMAAPGRALAGLGNAIAGLGDKLAEAEQQRRAVQEDSWLSRQRAEIALEMIHAEREAQQAATEGAEGYTAMMAGLFHARRAQRMAGAPTPRAAEMLSLWGDSYAVGLAERASQFQARSTLVKRNTDFGDAMNAHAQAVYADPTQFDAVMKRALDDFEGARQWMAPEQEAKARGELTRQIQVARIKHMADYRPAELLAELGGFSTNPRYSALTVEDVERARSGAESKLREIATLDRALVDAAVTNAPLAIQNTGAYAGTMPTAGNFAAAYGADGLERGVAFQSAIDVSKKSYDMRTMSTDEITAMVQAAEPKSSGDDAALETKRFEALSKAAKATIDAREADPAAYTIRTFPHVAEAWANVENGGSYADALAMTAAAQEKLGIRNMRLLPGNIADASVGRFLDPELREGERIDAVTNLILTTPDTRQQRAVFAQLVEAGLPEMTEGAFEALARGDQAAARRLFQAAIIDPKKLPGFHVDELRMRQADDAREELLSGTNGIADVYFGYSAGTLENYEAASRAGLLIERAIEHRLYQGENGEAAVAGAIRDFFGDVRIVDESWTVRAKFLIGREDDETPILEGLAELMPQVKTAMESRMAVPGGVDPATGQKAVLDAVAANYVANVLSEGHWRRRGDGFVFIDPYRGQAVADEKGAPIVFDVPNMPTAAERRRLQMDQKRAIREKLRQAPPEKE